MWKLHKSLTAACCPALAAQSYSELSARYSMKDCFACCLHLLVITTGCLRNILTLCFGVFLVSLSVMELYEFKGWVNISPIPPCAPPVCHSPLTLTRLVSRGQVTEQFGDVSELQEGMAKIYSTSFRGKAAGMVHGGMRPKMVCRQLSISRSQLYVWSKREKLGQGLASQPGCGRKSTLHPVVKRVIKMATGKRHQSTRKLLRRLTNAGYKVSFTTVHPYLRENLGMKPLKLKKSPKLTEKQRADRLKFARDRKKTGQWKTGSGSCGRTSRRTSCTTRQTDKTTTCGWPAAQTCRPSPPSNTLRRCMSGE